MGQDHGRGLIRRDGMFDGKRLKQIGEGCAEGRSNPRRWAFPVRLVVIGFLWGALTGFASADGVGRGGAAGGFLRLGTGARSLGMGGVGTALIGESEALLTNPAGVVFLTLREVTAGLSSMALDRKIQYVGYAQCLGAPEAKAERRPFQAGFALGWLSAGVDRIDGRDFDGLHTEMLSMDEHAFHFSFAIRPHPALGLGFNLKVLYGRFPGLLDKGDLSTSGHGFDLGLAIRPIKNLVFGVALHDLEAKYTWRTQNLYEHGSQTVDPFPSWYSIGLSGSPLQGVTGHLEVRQIRGWPVAWRGGVELALRPGLFLRAGLREEAWTAGLGLRMDLWRRWMRIDYAYVADPIAPRGDHVLTWHVAF